MAEINGREILGLAPLVKMAGFEAPPPAAGFPPPPGR
jgi:hypothetical protein